jgi:hypothetical protein
MYWFTEGSDTWCEKPQNPTPHVCTFYFHFPWMFSVMKSFDLYLCIIALVWMASGGRSMDSTARWINIIMAGPSMIQQGSPNRSKFYDTPLPYQVPSRHELPFVLPEYHYDSEHRFLRPIWDHVCYTPIVACFIIRSLLSSTNLYPRFVC